MRRLGTSELGAVTFVGRAYGDDKTGINGLPVTPASVRMLGRFQLLSSLQHPHMCAYLDLCRGRNDRVILVSEHHPTSVADMMARSSLNKRQVMSIFTQLLNAVAYLHSNRITIAYFSLQNVLVACEEPLTVRLSQYGLGYITENGSDVDFVVGLPWYMAPERLMKIPGVGASKPFGCKSDIWSLGIAMLEMAVGIQLSSVWGVRQIFAVLRSLIAKGKNGSALEPLLEALKVAKSDHCFDLPEALGDIIRQCLCVFPSQRPNARDLLRLLSDEQIVIDDEDCCENMNCVFQCYTNGFDMKYTTIRDMRERLERDGSWQTNPLSLRPIEQVYYLWKLSGSTVETILAKKGIIKLKPPINTLPSLVIGECDIFGNEESRRFLADLSITTLSLQNLINRLHSLPPERYIISLELKYGEKGDVKDAKPLKVERSSSSLAIVVKERDIEYQLDRMLLFERLIAAYPYKIDWLLKECEVDIPPLYRGFAWAAILNVRGDVALIYDQIDTETFTSTDRQIEVDIPRCHQYDELLASPTAHAKLKRILKAWVVTHPMYVYWQGLDSLSAPFVYLHFNNEALAYACLKAFISRYLHNFFLKDNSAIIQEYLAVFNHLLAFLDPQLYVHLRDIDFLPELYAIPWFLTMFAHVLPLRKLFHFWDAMLLGDSSFPLYFGVAILQDLRDRLLHYGFNECILMFSDLPDIDIERCVSESKRLYDMTPRSCTHRQHAPPLVDASSPWSKKNTASLTTMMPLDVTELKSYSCPRLSADDLMMLSRGSGTPFSTVLPLDVRPSEEFNRGAIPGSVNIPFVSSTSPFEVPSGAAGDALLRAKNSSVICVVGGSRMAQAKTFAQKLVEAGFVGVCVLDKGVDVLKHTSLLTVRTEL
uniref:TBC domain-containing protein kinase-like protein n=1 Tax=Plectus sambesii TaxID=2011161 RepID=A0A914UHY9_9BILA